MSLTGHPTGTIAPSNFQPIINALDEYAKLTGVDLSKTPFAERIQPSSSPNAILELLQEREKGFKGYHDANRRLIDCLSPAVRILHAFSGTLGEAPSQVPFPPAKAVFVGIDVLLAAASGVSSSYDALLDLFECLSSFLKRLEIYTDIPPTPMMTDIIVKIIVELLSVLSLATIQIKQGRFKKFAKKLFGESEAEAVLQRLDRLTQDEAQITAAQTLSVVHSLVNNTKVVIEDGKASTDGIRQSLTSIQEIVTEVNKVKRDQFQRDVRLWLSPPDPSTNHNIVLGGHQEGTAKWFFESSILADWKSNGSLLWIHGKPGCGKSTLLSAIIRDIEGLCAAGLATMAYYYCDFRDVKKQDRYGVVSSSLCQLSAKSDSCYEVLWQLYSDNAHGTGQPDNSALTECIKDMLSLPGQGPVYVIIDALNECPTISGTPSPREKVLELVEELVELNLPNVRLCVTSRPEVDIGRVLEPLTPLQISLHDETGQKEDIIEYIKSSLRSDPKMQRWREGDKQLIFDVLSARADRMFRWVVCQIERLRRSFPERIRDILHMLPETLDETYEQTLLGIDKEKRKYAQRLFQCLSVSIRPLRVDELAQILAVRFDETALPTFNPDWQPVDASEAVLSACSSLISVVDVAGSQVVQFSHFSVKEFLTSDRLANSESPLSSYHILPESAHSFLARASLSMLLQLDDKIDRNAMQNFPFALYAARYWTDHARIEGVSSHDDENMMKRLFDLSEPHFAAWVWLCDANHHSLDPMPEGHPTRPSAVPLYYASLYGLHGLVEHLVAAHPEEVNARGGFYDTPLHAASASGHLDVVQLLLNNMADPKICDKNGSTPLHSASRNGHCDVVKILLDHGMDVNQKKKDGCTPLHLASASRRLEMVLFLLKNGAIIDIRDGDQETPLYYAAVNGDFEITRLLLNSGANVNVTNGQSWTPLHSVCLEGHHIIVRLLLEHGAAVDVRDNEDQTALHIASQRGHLKVMRWLLGREANTNAENKARETPLFLTSKNGKLEATQLLLDYGANVNHQDLKGWTPLHVASKNGHDKVTKLLLERNAEVDAEHVNGWTPLHLASRTGRAKAAEILLDYHANVNEQDDVGWTPLHMASQMGQLKVVKLLLTRGATVNAEEADGKTALHLAVYCGHLEVAMLLLEYGVEVDTRDNEDQTPLHTASQHGDLEVMRWLLEREANTNAENEDRETPVVLASRNGKLEATRLLLDHGASVDHQDLQGRTPLHVASENGHDEVAKLLLERNAKVDAQHVYEWTPLHLASRTGKVKVAEILLEYHANVNEQNDVGWTPLHMASQKGHLDLVELLLSREAAVNAEEADGETALHLAAYYGHRSVAILLLKSGADLCIQNKEGRTPLDLAEKQGHDDIARAIAEAHDRVSSDQGVGEQKVITESE